MNPFEKNILSLYGKKGQQWLEKLPQLVQEYKALWNLTDLKPQTNLSYNYVLAGFQEGKPIMLKLSLDQNSLEKEAKALTAFQGYGAVSLIDKQEGALLLQRAVPGKSLKEAPKGRAIEIACALIEKLHQAPRPKEGVFPHIKDQLSDLDKEWNIPRIYLEKARKLKNQLLPQLSNPILLHGDLHQDNILSHGSGWLVIDPKGVIGFPINEVWACVEDPEYDLAFISKYFHFAYGDVVRWYYIHLILAACWQVEDGLDPKLFLDLADTCLRMAPTIISEVQ